MRDLLQYLNKRWLLSNTLLMTFCLSAGQCIWHNKVCVTVSSISNVYVTLRFCCVYVICIWQVVFFDTLCVSFSFVFQFIYCFVAVIYANKDVYKVLESDLWSLNFFNCCLPLNSQQWTSLIVRFRQPHIRTSITHESTILKKSSSDWLKSREVVYSIWVKRCVFLCLSVAPDIPETLIGWGGRINYRLTA